MTTGIFRPDPTEDESIQWVKDDVANDANEAREAAEDRAWAAMDAHAPEWIEWLYAASGEGADLHTVARLLSLFLKGSDATEAEIIDRGLAAMALRADYCYYVEAST